MNIRIPNSRLVTVTKMLFYLQVRQVSVVYFILFYFIVQIIRTLVMCMLQSFRVTLLYFRVEILQVLVVDGG